LSNENHGESCVLEESKYNILPRVKRFKTRILIEPSFENASAEVCLRKCGLLAYSPMAFGILSGKF
jgi:aryl-alcohol dehydrogenase-like predicted oxidoreductase